MQIENSPPTVDQKGSLDETAKKGNNSYETYNSGLDMPQRNRYK